MQDLPLFRAIAAAYASGGSTMQDIGDYFGLHYSRASKTFRAESQYRSGARGKTLFPSMQAKRWTRVGGG